MTHICPICDSSDVYANDSDNVVFCDCNDCGAQWDADFDGSVLMVTLDAQNVIEDDAAVVWPDDKPMAAELTKERAYKLAQHYDRRHRAYAALSRERGLTTTEARDYHAIWQKRMVFLRRSGCKHVIQVS
jgi:hypothetical protein